MTANLAAAKLPKGDAYAWGDLTHLMERRQPTRLPGSLWVQSNLIYNYFCIRNYQNIIPKNQAPCDLVELPDEFGLPITPPTEHKYGHNLTTGEIKTYTPLSWTNGEYYDVRPFMFPQPKNITTAKLNIEALHGYTDGDFAWNDALMKWRDDQKNLLIPMSKIDVEDCFLNSKFVFIGDRYDYQLFQAVEAIHQNDFVINRWFSETKGIYIYTRKIYG